MGHGVAHGDEACDRLAASKDDDFGTGLYFPEQFRQVGLGLVNADLVRRERDGRTKQFFVEGRSFARLADGWLRRMAGGAPAPQIPKEA